LTFYNYETFSFFHIILLFITQGANLKTILTIAGSDSSGGAGIQADLKTFEAFGLFGASAITVLTAQNTQGVDAIQSLPASFVKAQILSILNDFDIYAIKIGMLYNTEVIQVVKEIIAELDIPIVLDPVFISKAGSMLLQDEAIDSMRELFKYATIITPNRYEAQALFGSEYTGHNSLEQIQGLGVPVLIKNYVHEAKGTKLSIDELYFADQRKVFESEHLDTTNLHGTGCSYSSAIAANLALGNSLEDSIEISKKFITEALRYAQNIGNGHGPINHKKGGQHV
jgi:hydroxymethylpyrimidine/phosphomethylpyrimidine kinase